MILTRKRLLVDIFLTRSLSKSLVSLRVLILSPGRVWHSAVKSAYEPRGSSGQRLSLVAAA